VPVLVSLGFYLYNVMDMSEIDKLPIRGSIRLPQFDYSQVGQYFVTICVFQMRCLFGTSHPRVSSLVASGLGISSRIAPSAELRLGPCIFIRRHYSEGNTNALHRCDYSIIVRGEIEGKES